MLTQLAHPVRDDVRQMIEANNFPPVAGFMQRYRASLCSIDALLAFVYISDLALQPRNGYEQHARA